ncbi:MAG TPA: PAS domain S-box protein [Anaerolineae bacterium]|nr:PAS domain S-box protein [Anaerolineae bacterium]
MAALVLVSDLEMWGLLRRGYLTLPRVWLPTLLLLMITHSVARTDGLHARGVFLYPVIIAIAGLLLGQQGVALFGALSIMAVTGVGWAEVTGRLVTRYSADITWTTIAVLDALLVGVTVIFYLTIHNLMLSLMQMRRSEQALHATQAELRQERDTAQMYLDVAGVIMLALDADERVQLINQKGLATLACELEDIIGQNWFDTFVPTHDRERARATFKQLLNGPLTPNLESFENTIVTRSGAERLIAWHNVVLRDAADRATGTFSSGEDVTAREQAQQQVRESNARYRALFEQAGQRRDLGGRSR